MTLAQSDAEPLIYCFVDIETDGPSPVKNSMLSFACVAYSDDEAEIQHFQRNLSGMEGAVPDPHTMAWWRTEPEAWAISTRDPQPPELVMQQFVEWVKSLPGGVVFAAHPMIFDGVWIDAYLRRFTNTGVFGSPRERPLFLAAGIDIPAYVQAALGRDYARKRPDYPPRLTNYIVHNHDPLDDARGHAALYFNARRASIRRDPDILGLKFA